MQDVSQETQEPLSNGDKRNPDGTFAKGYAGGPGRPVGSVSPITRVKQIFQEKPEVFESFISEYVTDPNNRKHIVEMIDGKPMQKTDVTSGGETITPILVKFIDNEDHRNPEGV